MLGFQVAAVGAGSHKVIGIQAKAFGANLERLDLIVPGEGAVARDKFPDAESD